MNNSKRMQDLKHPSPHGIIHCALYTLSFYITHFLPYLAAYVH